MENNTTAMITIIVKAVGKTRVYEPIPLENIIGK